MYGCVRGSSALSCLPAAPAHLPGRGRSGRASSIPMDPPLDGTHRGPTSAPERSSDGRVAPRASPPALLVDPRVEVVLRWGLVLATAGFFVVLLVVAGLRLTYPFELEWMEGAVTDHVRRITAGERLYVEPSLDFIPFTYGPLYFYVSAFVSLFSGPGHLALRLVSLVSSLGSFALVFRFVQRETLSRRDGVVALGLLSATFAIGGLWFDLARVDSLHLFLLLLTAYLVRFGASPRTMLAAGLLGGLAFLTRQTAVIALVPLMAYLFHRSRRHCGYFAAASLGLIVLSTLVLDRFHDGWYVFYVLELPRSAPISRIALLDFWREDLLPRAGILFCFSVFYLASRLYEGDLDGFLFYALLAAGLVGESWVSRQLPGEYGSTLMPAWATLAILGSLALGEVRRRVKEPLGSRARLAVTIPVYVALMTQLAVLLYNPRYHVPSTTDGVEGARLLRLIESMDGEVLLPHHGYIAAMAGKRTHAHHVAVRNVLRGAPRPVQEQLAQEIDQALRERRFAAVIIDEPWRLSQLEATYVLVGEVSERGDVFLPRTGEGMRPTSLYVPDEPEPPPPEGP